MVELKGKMGNVKFSERVLEYETSRKSRLDAISGPAKESIITFSMRTVEGKTRFTSTNDLKFSGFYKLVGPLIIPKMRKDVVNSLGNVKRVLDLKRLHKHIFNE